MAGYREVLGFPRGKMMKAFQRLSVAGKMLTAAGVVVGFLLLIAAFAVSQHTRSVARDLSGDYASALGQQAASQVETRLSEIAGGVRTLAADIGAKFRHQALRHGLRIAQPAARQHLVDLAERKLHALRAA